MSSLGIEHLNGPDGEPYGHIAFVETMIASAKKWGIKTDGETTGSYSIANASCGRCLTYRKP